MFSSLPCFARLLPFACLILISNTDAFTSEPIYVQKGMVAGPEPFAVRAGVEILRQGGNAYDAAAAVGFALAVTYPQAGNLGGGGFLVAYSSDEVATFLDFRETAPSAATRDLFLDEQGEIVPGRSTDTLLAVGVPGTVNGLLRINANWGNLTREAILAPAIHLAEEGFPLSRSEARSLRSKQERLSKFPSTAEIFFPQGKPLSFGEILKQPELANTLRLIAEHGRDGFYAGETADRIVEFMQENGGIITHEDLAQYESNLRQPIVVNHGEYRIIAPNLPSSGGIAIAQILKLIAPYDLKGMGFHSAQYVRTLVEAERLAFADRNHFLGDPDFVQVPERELLSNDYLNRRRELIPPNGAGNSEEVSHGKIGIPSAESPQTTHYCVVDEWRNVVAVTYTLNGAYGMGAVVKGAGFLLNNEMDDFSAKPGEANMFGLVQGENNAIEPGKRMLSSMTPIIVLKNKKFDFTVGTPGGPTIITTNLQVFLNRAVFGMNIREAIDAGRFHHQWLPDEVSYERFSLSPDTLEILREMGYDMREVGEIGFAVGIQALEDGTLAGYTDKRGEGLVEGY